MAVLKNKDNTELYVDCCCGCNEGIRLVIDKDSYNYYCIMAYTNGKFYVEQDSIWSTLRKKLKKIWAIIRNKDFYYAEVTMTKDEFEEFKGYINNIE